MESRVNKINVKELLQTVTYYVVHNIVTVDAFIKDGMLYLKPTEKPNPGDELGDLTKHV